MDSIDDQESLNESNDQAKINRKIARSYLTANNIDPKRYLVHHLDGEIVSEVGSIKNNDYDNILFVRKAFRDSQDDIHKLIHIAARLGGVDELINILKSWNTAKETKTYIYAVDPADKISLIPINIQDAVNMTMTKHVDSTKRIENPQGGGTQLSIDI